MRTLEFGEAMQRLKDGVVNIEGTTGIGLWYKIRRNGKYIEWRDTDGEWEYMNCPLEWAFREAPEPKPKATEFAMGTHDTQFIWKRGGMEGDVVIVVYPEPIYLELCEAEDAWLWNQQSAENRRRLAAAIRSARGM